MTCLDVLLQQLTSQGRRRAERLARAQETLFDGLLERLTDTERGTVLVGLDHQPRAARGG